MEALDLELGERQLAEAEAAFVRLQVDREQLEERLRQDLRPRLFKARKDCMHFREQRDTLLTELDNLAAGRQEAVLQLSGITRQELVEIKQFGRRPPDVIRRTVIASYMLLHCVRFKGRAVHFNEAEEWWRCQRMLARDDFILEIMRFDGASLDDVPHVAKYIAHNIFGWPDDEDALRRHVFTAALRPGSPGEQVRVNRGDERVVLDVKTVDNASRPCGTLMRWIAELMKEHAQREGIRVHLAQLNPSWQEAECRQARCTAENNEAEEELRRLRALVTQQQSELEALRTKQIKARRAVQDLARLDVLNGSPKQKPMRCSSVKQFLFSAPLKLVPTGVLAMTEMSENAPRMRALKVPVSPKAVRSRQPIKYCVVATGPRMGGGGAPASSLHTSLHGFGFCRLRQREMAGRSRRTL